MKKLYILLLFFIFSLFYISKSPIFFQTQLLYAYAKPITQDSINIEGNSQFTEENGVISGNGSKNNPYVIEGLNILITVDNVGITIKDTTKHFIIKNCYIHGEKGLNNNNAIYIDNAINGVIDNVTIEYARNGIDITHKSSITSITNCIFTGCGCGIYNFEGSTINIIDNCSIYDSLAWGIFNNGITKSINNCTISGSGMQNIYNNGMINTILNCTISDSAYGIFNDYGKMLSISNCEISGNGTAIHNDHGDISIIARCNIEKSNEYALYNNNDISINAINCWWGRSNGPNTTNEESGNKIQGKVNYKPYVKTKIENAGANVNKKAKSLGGFGLI